MKIIADSRHRGVRVGEDVPEWDGPVDSFWSLSEAEQNRLLEKVARQAFRDMDRRRLPTDVLTASELEEQAERVFWTLALACGFLPVDEGGQR